MNYYERYCGDYARDTGHLSLQEHGAYTVMLDTYYATETPLPADYPALYRICRAMSGKEKEAVRKVADEFFRVEEDGLRHNPRTDAVISKAQKRIAAARANGMASREPTGGATGVSSSHIGTTTRPQTPDPSNSKRKNKGSAQAPFVLPEWIPEEPWQAWVEARTKARKAPTDYAKRLAVLKLDNYRAEGHAPAQVLMNAAFNGWSGLFPPKEIK